MYAGECLERVPSGHSSDDQYAVTLAVETTGSVVGVHALLAVGAAVVDLRTQMCVQYHEWYLRPSGTWDDSCVAEYWSQRPELAAYLASRPLHLNPQAAGQALHEWLQRVLGTKAKVFLVVDAAAFTVPWLDALLGTAGLPPMHLCHPKGGYQPVVDLQSVYLAAKHLAFWWPSRWSLLPPILSSTPTLLTPKAKAYMLGVRFARCMRSTEWEPVVSDTLSGPAFLLAPAC